VLLVAVAAKLEITTLPEAVTVLVFVLLNVPALVKSVQVMDAPEADAL
jgi:hypothetical protein